MGVIKVLIALIIIAGAAYFGYNYYSQNSAPQYGPIDAAAQASQFVPDLRFANSRVSYFINSNCNADRRTQLELALRVISSSAPALSFYPASEANADILMGCSKDSYEQEPNVFTAGEGGPTSYLNLSYYPLIKRGKVLLYQKSDCTYPVVEIHELLHVLGFAHVNNKTNIMFPYAVCTAKMDPQISEIIQKLYSVEPLAELSFGNASATVSGGYMTLYLEVTNQGLKIADNVNVMLYADNSQLDPIEMGTIEMGQTQTVKIKNIKLPQNNVKTISLVIEYPEKEFNKNNNALKLTI